MIVFDPLDAGPEGMKQFTQSKIINIAKNVAAE
jgi:hypothetical protein